MHITPFSKDLAQAFLSKDLNLATDTISYHTLETFPEHNYGYIELPTMEAVKLKKKLHGSILKGKRICIEQARPPKRVFVPEKNEGDSLLPKKQESGPSKKSRKSDAELQGHELASERRIKRGWTEPEKRNEATSLAARASPRVASQYTEKPECMFRLQVPLNREIDTPGSKRKEKDQGTKKAKKVKLVHEFEKSVIQPSFIRNETGSTNVGVAAEYVDGKGWVDKDGIVLEGAGQRQLRSSSRTTQSQRAHTLPKSTIPSLAHKSSRGGQRSSRKNDEDRDKQEDTAIATPEGGCSAHINISIADVVDEETSSSGISSSSLESSSQSDEEPEQALESLENIRDISEANSTAGLAVHPLEALFKRPKQAASQTHGKRPLEIKTTFNFFEPDEEQKLPQTPFTTRDLQLRGLRSAAPTPDTAHPTRRFFAESVSPSNQTGTDDRADLDGPSHGLLPSEESGQKEGESDFAKWFWEHRGDNNRAWKRRRRETMKEKRQRENRQKGRRSG